ncbi:Hypothetical predicted protein [Olea europaea subsp. europaea]|uniref:Uncharacterized protein n=1 Tax=Olea europaea subsp. europaea TaxID=158383 RepID=A0A8S0SPY1_OLEEU|nr:Hypothetical predicted protein [Olea europaea subsp. europaea]
MTRASSGKRGEKTGIHESGRRVKRKLDEVQKESSSNRQKSKSSVGKQSSKKLEICDLDPPPAELAMPYMSQVQYEKPILPNRSHGEKRKGGSIHRSDHRAGTSTKPSNPGMKQSTPMLLITDGRLGHSDLPIDDDDFVDAPPSWKGTSIHEDSPTGEFKSDDTTDSEDMPSKDAAKVERSVGSKGKAKVDSVCAVEFPCSIEPPSFDLGLGFTQPSQIVAKASKEVDRQVESVIADVLKDTECFQQEHSPEAAPSSGLPVKRAPKPAKALQSPYVADKMKQMKSSGNVVVFEHYNQNVQDADVADFQNWFQRGYKPHNKKKFNDKDYVIRPPFSIGQYLVEKRHGGMNLYPGRCR